MNYCGVHAYTHLRLIACVIVMAPPQPNVDLQVILGAAIGVVLAVCVGLLLFLLRKHPKKFKKVFVSFMRTSNGL